MLRPIFLVYFTLLMLSVHLTLSVPVSGEDYEEERFMDFGLSVPVTGEDHKEKRYNDVKITMPVSGEDHEEERSMDYGIIVPVTGEDNEEERIKDIIKFIFPESGEDHEEERSMDFGISVPVTVDDHKCLQPIERGWCRAYFPSYGFDKATKRCVKFIYGGCDHNDNIFQTMKECESVCKLVGQF